jgi:carbon monoxide dehydrogenase subunit G
MPTTSARPSGPIEILLQAGIRAPAETVWGMLVDWEHLGAWMLEASDVRVTSQQREGVGTEVEARVRIGGIATTDSVRVTRWEPPHALGIAHLGWVKGHAVIECTPTDSGTRVTWTERLQAPMGVVGALGIRAFKPLMTKTFARDLGALKRRCELRAGTREPARPAGGRREQQDERELRREVGAPPGAATVAGRPRGPAASSLFARWFWLVYLPLGLLATVLLLVGAGIMPRPFRVPLLVATGIWSGLALRLLVERRRRRLTVPAPRSIVVGIGAVVLLAVVGAVLTWVGIGRVSTSAGLAMLLVGCFFMLMAVFAPMFKLVDSGFRLAARVLTRHRRPVARRPAEEPAGAGGHSEAGEPSYSTKP